MLFSVSGSHTQIPYETAPPLWSRFYEIQTNRPLYVDRVSLDHNRSGRWSRAPQRLQLPGTWPGSQSHVPLPTQGSVLLSFADKFAQITVESCRQLSEPLGTMLLDVLGQTYK